MFQTNDNPYKLTDEELLDEIQSLEFANFKYRTALLSSNKDLIHNEKELMDQCKQLNHLESKILSTKK